MQSIYVIPKFRSWVVYFFIFLKKQVVQVNMTINGGPAMKRLSISLFSIFLLFLMGSMSIVSVYAEAPSGYRVISSDSACTITGTVVDFSTNKPVTNATVAIQNQDISVQTNSSGTFELDNLNKGTYMVKVTADGYREYDKTIKAGPDSQSIIIKLTPADSQ